jgi:hypothetical protein
MEEVRWTAGSTPAGVSLRWVVRGEETPDQAGQAEQNPEKAPCRLFRTCGTAGWSARGSLSSIGGREEWSISEITVPHWDNRYPGSLDKTRDRRDITDAQKREVLADHYRRLYGI